MRKMLNTLLCAIIIGYIWCAIYSWKANDALAAPAYWQRQFRSQCVFWSQSLQWAHCCYSASKIYWLAKNILLYYTAIYHYYFSLRKSYFGSSAYSLMLWIAHTIIRKSKYSRVIIVMYYGQWCVTKARTFVFVYGASCIHKKMTKKILFNRSSYFALFKTRTIATLCEINCFYFVRARTKR